MSDLTTYRRSRRRLSILCLLLLSLGSLLVASPRAQAHTPHDVIRDVALSPNYAQDRTIFAVISNTQTPTTLFRSDDGGATWQELVKDLATEVKSIAVSPDFATDHLVVVGTLVGLYRSTNRGDSWSLMTDQFAVSKLALSPTFGQDKAACVITTSAELHCTRNRGVSWDRQLDGVSIQSLAFIQTPRTAWLLAGDMDGALHLSKNYGQRWRTLTLPLTHGGALTALAANTQAWFVGTEADGIFRSTDGATFTPVNTGDLPTDEPVTSLALSPNFADDGTLFATTRRQAVFRSTDAGETWQRFRSILTGHRQADELDVPYFSKVVISDGYATDGAVFMATFTGLYRSADYGVHWAEFGIFPHYVWTIALSPDYATDATAFIGEYTGGIYRTQDGGQAWRVLNQNIWVLRPFDIAFSPGFVQDNTVFLGVRDYFYRSTDGGENWLAQAIPGMGQLRISPGFVTDHTLFIKTQHSNLFKSTDGGATFNPVWESSDSVLFTMVLSSDYGNDQTIFIRLEGAGVFRSQDGGQSWQPINTGLVIPANDAHGQLAVSADYANDQTVFTTSQAGLFKSTNGGELWSLVESVPYTGENNILALALSPDYAHDQTLFITLEGRGLYKSQDGGQSFVEMAPWLIQHHQLFDVLVLSPTYAVDQTLLGAGRDLFKSTDGGQTWTPIAIPIRYEDEEEPMLFGPVEEPLSRNLSRAHFADDNNGNLHGHWRRTASVSYSATTSTWSNTALDTASLEFVGNCVSWVGSLGSDQGIANVYVDGALQAVVDQYSPAPATMLSLFSLNGLGDGLHTIVVEVTGTHNPLSSGAMIYVDAFDVDTYDGDGGWCE